MQPEPTSAQYVWKDDYFCHPRVEAFPVQDFFFQVFVQELVSNTAKGEIDPDDEIWLNFCAAQLGCQSCQGKTCVTQSEPVLVRVDWEMVFIIMYDILRVFPWARKMVTFFYDRKT